MGKSKNRKNHKARVQNFKQKQAKEVNETRKFEGMLLNKYMEYTQNARRESVIETVYERNPHFLTSIDGALHLNDEMVDFVENVMVWKENNTPVLTEIEPSEAHTLYTRDMVIRTIEQIQTRLSLIHSESTIKTVAVDLETELGTSDIPEAVTSIVDDPNNTL
jgi:hypothetical protein